MNDQQIPKIVAFGEAEKDRRSVERPLKTWINCIQEDLKLFGISFDECVQKSLNKNNWLKLPDDKPKELNNEWKKKLREKREERRSRMITK